jgi:hypothetical protein
MSVSRDRKKHNAIHLTTEKQTLKATLTDDDMRELRRYLAALHPNITLVQLEALGNELYEVRLGSKEPSADIPAAITRWNEAIASNSAWVVMQLRVAYEQYHIEKSEFPDELSISQSVGTYLRGASEEDFTRFDFDVPAVTLSGLKEHDRDDLRLNEFLKVLLTVNAVYILPSNPNIAPISFGP